MKRRGVAEELLLLGILIFASSVQQGGSLNPPVTEWAKTYGIYENSEEAYSLVQTDDGGYAMLGQTRHYFAGWVYTADFWLVKTDINGNMEWNRTYGLPTVAYLEMGRSLVRTDDGGYVLAGDAGTEGSEGTIYDFWLVKADSMGNMEWNRTYGGVDTDLAHSVVRTSDGGYAIAGITFSYGEGSGDVYLVKTDSNGNMEWNQTYGGTSSDVGRCVVPSGDGGYVIAGYTRSYGAGYYDVWLIRTDSAGDIQWNRTYGGVDGDMAYSVVRTNDGGYAIAGKTSSFGAGGYDFWLIKTDSAGNMEWNQTYGGTYSDEANSLVQTNDGSYALLGWTNSFEVPAEYWLVKTDSSGNMQWNQTYGKGNLSDLGYAVIQTVDGGYAMAGSSNYYINSSYAVVDFWLVKVAPDTIAGDCDGDGDVDYDDLVILAGAYGSTTGQPSYRSEADFDNDGDVDYDDLIILAGNYGTSIR